MLKVIRILTTMNVYRSTVVSRIAVLFLFFSVTVIYIIQSFYISLTFSSHLKASAPEDTMRFHTKLMGRKGKIHHGSCKLRQLKMFQLVQRNMLFSLDFVSLALLHVLVLMYYTNWNHQWLSYRTNTHITFVNAKQCFCMNMTQADGLKISHTGMYSCNIPCIHHPF